MENNSAKYGSVYSEIVAGLSKKTIDGKDYYFKHPTQAEHFDIYGKYFLVFNDAKKRGLLSEAQKLEDAIQNSWWTSEKESRYQQISSTIKALRVTKSNLLLPSQKDQIQKEIDRNGYILSTFEKERRELIGYTAERYTNDRIHDEMLLALTYKNEHLTERLFTDREEYYYLSDTVVESIRNEFFSCMSLFSSDIIKKVAACPFFQNMLYVTSDCDAMNFWGTPPTKCTKYQIDLLINGKVLKNAVKSEMEQGNAVADDILSDPDKLVAWYDSRIEAPVQKSTQNNYSGSNNTVTSFVGATKEDLNKMGVKIEKIRGKSLLQMAEENGGTLQKHEYLNARDGM